MVDSPPGVDRLPDRPKVNLRALLIVNRLALVINVFSTSFYPLISSPPVEFSDMASPNARMALQAHPTYLVLAPRHQKPWLDHVESLGALTVGVDDGEVFRDDGHCLERLNAWGFKQGCRWVVGKSRAQDPTPS